MQVDLTNKISALGKPLLAIVENRKIEGMGVLSPISSCKAEEFTPQPTTVGVCSGQKYNLWMVLSSPSRSLEPITKIQIGKRSFQRVSGRFDPMFCCYRFIVEEEFE